MVYGPVRVSGAVRDRQEKRLRFYKTEECTGRKYQQKDYGVSLWKEKRKTVH